MWAFLLQNPLEIAVKGLALAVLVGTLEYLFLWRYLSQNGMFSWNVGQLIDFSALIRNDRRLLLFALSDRIFFTILLLRLVAAIYLLFYPFYSTPGTFALALITFASVASLVRTPYGHEAADQLVLVVAVASLIATIFRANESFYEYSVIMIAFQLVIFYMTAGITKLVSVDWRSGSALSGVGATLAYGWPTLNQRIAARLVLYRLTTWCLMIWEATFGLWLLSPFLTSISLAIGVLFHISTSLLMGLNKFLIIFVGCYPCVLCVSVKLPL